MYVGGKEKRIQNRKNSKNQRKTRELQTFRIGSRYAQRGREERGESERTNRKGGKAVTTESLYVLLLRGGGGNLGETFRVATGEGERSYRNSRREKTHVETWDGGPGVTADIPGSPFVFVQKGSI